MSAKELRLTLCIFAVATACSAPAMAQTPSFSPTIWRFLGLPQARDALINRRGLFPRAERPWPLKKIADPANFESNNEAIKRAAEIKYQEDLKKQKIKAIKYLADMGCGCYDKDGSVTEALIAAMGDCTEDVRLAAVRAVTETARNGRCQKCNSPSCCGEDMAKKLSELAYEMDDEGCPVEPSEQVRRAAVRALQTCCPGRPLPPCPPEGIQGGTGEMIDPDIETPEPAKLPSPEDLPPMPPALDDTEATIRFNDQFDRGAPAADTAPITSRRTARMNPPTSYTSASAEPVRTSLNDAWSHETTPAASSRRNESAVYTPAAPARNVSASYNQPAAARGVVEMFEGSSSRAVIRLASGNTLPNGTQMQVYHRFLPLGLGDAQYRVIAVVEVIDGRDGYVEVQLVETSGFASLTRGDIAVAGQ